MSDRQPHAPAGGHPRRRHTRFGRNARLGVAAGALLALGAILGALATLSLPAGAHFLSGHPDHGPGHVTERVLDRTAWVLARVDATPEQEARMETVVRTAVEALLPLHEQHRAHRRAMLAELARDEVDAARLESLRRKELELADLASARILDAVVEATDVLSAEQRGELLERVTRHGHHH